MELSDDEIIIMIRKKSIEAWNMLLFRYQRQIKYLANKVIHKAPYCGVEIDDLINTGTVCLFSAIENYESNRALFFSFWSLLCEREMYRTINKNTNFSQNNINYALSLDYSYESDDCTLLDCLPSDQDNIVQKLKFEEDITNYESNLQQEVGSDEARIRLLQVYGFSYEEIAKIVHRSYSQVLHILRKLQRKAKNSS